MKTARSIPMMVVVTLMLSMMAESRLEAAAISCRFPNVSCWPCCSNCNYCIDDRSCTGGTFNAVNDEPSGKRTGFKVCGESWATKTVTFSVNGKTASVLVSGYGCVEKHLDELSWWNSEPIFSSLTSVAFTVSSGETVSMVTSRTLGSSYYNPTPEYNLYKISTCFEPPPCDPFYDPDCPCEDGSRFCEEY